MNIQSIIDIIQEPAHGEKFYTRETMQAVVKKVEEICRRLEISENTSQKNIVTIVNNYIKYNVQLRNPYFDTFCERTENFDQTEEVYRTAYGALIKGEAMCAGFTEALRIILAQYGIKTYTALAKLPGSNKRLIHYVAIAEHQNDGRTKYMVLDPERQANCEKRGMDFERYKANMIYMAPNFIFTSDVIGKNGLGISAEEYLNHSEIFRIHGTEELPKLVEKIKEFTKQHNSKVNNGGENNDGEVGRA